MLLWSIVAEALYRRAHTPGYKAAFNVIAFIGVFVHEVAHYTVSLMVGVEPGKFRVKFKSESSPRVAPHGSVENPEFERNSFLQQLAASFAPMLMCTFLLMFCIDVVVNIQTDLIVNIVTVIFGISLLIGLEPSGQDVKVIGYSFKNDPRYSIYQICLLLGAIAIMWIFIDLYVLVLPFEVLYYVVYFVVLTCFYFGLKGIFWIVGRTVKGIAKKMGKVQVASPKFLTRRRRFKQNMKGFCLIAIIVAMLMFYQKEPFYTVVIIGVGVIVYLVYKAKKSGNGLLGAFFSGNQSHQDSRLDDLIALMMLQQLSSTNSQSNNATQQISEQARKRREAIDKTQKEVLDLLSSD